jgi:hypothetical protein
VANYYTRRRTDGVWGELNGPFGSHDDAMNDHTRVVSMISPATAWPAMQTFIDLATIVGDEQATQRLLHTDPVMKTVFDLGRRIGRQDAERLG